MDWEGLNGNSHIESRTTELHGNYTDTPTASFASLCYLRAISVIRVVAFSRRSAATESLNHVPLHQRRVRRNALERKWRQVERCIRPGRHQLGHPQPHRRRLL